MPSTEVQRTLVKSPPELWTELSDPASLARHLGELGEIRVTRVEPETAVEWEAEKVRGSVQLKPSGWGTKVTFSVTRGLPEPAAQEPERELPEPEQVLPEQAEPELAKLEPTAPAPGEPEPAEPEPMEAEAVESGSMPTPRPGFLARLFRRRRSKQPTPEPTPEPEAATIGPGSKVEPEARPEPEPAIETEPAGEAVPATEQATPAPAPLADSAESSAEDCPADLTAELAAMEQAIVEQDTQLLTAVLDRLGAAHHRPFSRG